MSRALAYIPVLHSPQDLDSLASAVSPPREQSIKVAGYWERLWQECRAYGRTWQGIRVYQEGLPNAGEDAVAGVVSEADSENYRLLRWLADMGAVVVGTEDPVLLQEERELLRAGTFDDAIRRVRAARAAGLLEARDRYIAARIGATLPEGGTGAVFVGLQHDLARLLPADITLTSLRACEEVLPGVPGYVERQAADAERDRAQTRGGQGHAG